MALTYTPLWRLPAASGGEAFAQTSVTLDASYAPGGIVIDPAQWGLSKVFGGTVNVRTGVATHSPSDGAIDATSMTAPKLKLVAESALGELGAGFGSGAVLDIMLVGSQ